MFTGLIESVAEIVSIETRQDSIRLVVSALLSGKKMRLGESIALNGCCLTLVNSLRRGTRTLLHFDLLDETWKRTNFQDLQKGSPVNLEPSLRGESELGGHFVTGHVDGLGTISRWEKAGRDHRLVLRIPKEMVCYVVKKGSISVDGISLTVADLAGNRIGLWIIPHTYEATNLKFRKVGERVNIETDMLGKYVVRFLESTPRRRPRS